MDQPEPSFKNVSSIMSLTCLKTCTDVAIKMHSLSLVAHQSPTTLISSLFFNMSRSFPPQGLCTCGSFLWLQYCCMRPKGEGNTTIWSGLFLPCGSPSYFMDRAFQPNRRFACILIVWVPPPFPRPLMYHGPFQISLCSSQVFTLS